MGANSPKHTVIVVNGSFSHEQRLLAVLAQADRIIAADGGANWLRRVACQPDLLLGDLDSITSESERALRAQGVEVRRYRRDKDETDTELAIMAAITDGSRQITLLGATGGRIDHELANILLLAQPNMANVNICIYDGLSWLRVLQEGCQALLGSAGDLVSLLPLREDCVDVHTVGLEYGLKGETLPLGPARGVSNVMLGERAQVCFASGALLVVHTPLAHLESR